MSAPRWEKACGRVSRETLRHSAAVLGLRAGFAVSCGALSEAAQGLRYSGSSPRSPVKRGLRGTASDREAWPAFSMLERRALPRQGQSMESPNSPDGATRSVEDTARKRGGLSGLRPLAAPGGISLLVPREPLRYGDPTGESARTVRRLHVKHRAKARRAFRARGLAAARRAGRYFAACFPRTIAPRLSRSASAASDGASSRDPPVKHLAGWRRSAAKGRFSQRAALVACRERGKGRMAGRAGPQDARQRSKAPRGTHRGHRRAAPQYTRQCSGREAAGRNRPWNFAFRRSSAAPAATAFTRAATAATCWWTRASPARAWWPNCARSASIRRSSPACSSPTNTSTTYAAWACSRASTTCPCSPRRAPGRRWRTSWAA